MAYVGVRRRPRASRQTAAAAVAQGLIYALSLLCGVAAAVVMLPATVRRGMALNGWLRATARAVHAAAVRDSRELAIALR